MTLATLKQEAVRLPRNEQVELTAVLMERLFQSPWEHDLAAECEAIIDAGRTRLRPVMLTAITTILGLIPMAIGYSLEIHTWPPKIVAGAENSQWWAPMAWAVMIGLLVSTLLTLILVPVMFSLADSMAARFKKRFGIVDD